MAAERTPQKPKRNRIIAWTAVSLLGLSATVYGVGGLIGSGDRAENSVVREYCQLEDTLSFLQRESKRQRALLERDLPYVLSEAEQYLGFSSGSERADNLERAVEVYEKKIERLEKSSREVQNHKKEIARYGLLSLGGVICAAAGVMKGIYSLGRRLNEF